jgi:mRNA interferase HigB
LREFWQQDAYRDSEHGLKAWYREAKKAAWRTPQDIKEQFRNASFIWRNRVVFNICGNKYRLIGAVRYDAGIIFIRFIGTHKQYDRIDPEVI